LGLRSLCFRVPFSLRILTVAGSSLSVAGSSLGKSYGWIDGEHGKLMRWLALSTICLEIGGQEVSGGNGGGAKRG
jgi:hypothetical protein